MSADAGVNSIEAITPIAKESTIRLWCETLAVTIPVFVPWLALSIRSWHTHRAGVQSLIAWTSGAVWSDLLTTAACAAFPLFFMATSTESFSGFGVRPLRWRKDVLLGLGLTLIAYGLTMLEYRGRYGVWAFRDHALPGCGWGLTLLVGIAAIIASAFLEELIFRAWLITRLGSLSGSQLLAFIASSVLFASFHVHQGLKHFPAVLLFGMLMGGCFVFTRRLWPCVLCHAFYNLWVLI